MVTSRLLALVFISAYEQKDPMIVVPYVHFNPKADAHPQNRNNASRLCDGASSINIARCGSLAFLYAGEANCRLLL
jgi:hypothetical protein